MVENLHECVSAGESVKKSYAQENVAAWGKDSACLETTKPSTCPYGSGRVEGCVVSDSVAAAQLRGATASGWT